MNLKLYTYFKINKLKNDFIIRLAAPGIEVESPRGAFAEWRFGEAATKGSHRNLSDTAKDQGAWNVKPDKAPKKIQKTLKQNNYEN